MLRAIKAAFLLRWPVNGLGDVPVNIVGLACLGALGLGNHGFWLAGIGLETLYLATLVSNRRFLNWVAAQDKVVEDGSVSQKLKALVDQLAPDSRRSMDHLNQRCGKIEALWHATDEFQLGTNEQALRDLQWFYLKLLIARQHMQSADSDADMAKVQHDIGTIERELADPRLSPATRESKTATLAILKKRSENFERRKQSLDEIASDLARIEAQIDLVLENATLEGKPQSVAINLDLASQALDSGAFGSSAADVADVDAAYSQASMPKDRA
jgi:hypothetical protein